MTAATVTTFWLLLSTPGLAVLRRWSPQSLEGGVLSGMSLGTLATFTLLTPVAVVCFLGRLPLAVLSGVVVLAVAVAVTSLVRDLVHGWTRPSIGLLALTVGGLLLADLAMSLRVGSYLGGDARYHIARVRLLVDHGFNNWDPLVPGHRFDAIYHSNLYHALMASAAQLTGSSPPEVWVYTWCWAKLVTASTVFHLAWTVFRDRGLAWSATAAAIVWLAPISILPYPNTLTRYWLLPLVFAFLADAVRGDAGKRPVIGLGAVALVLPHVHGLYYVFACLVAGPVLAVAWLHANGRRLPGRRTLGLSVMVLALGVPWLAVSKWHGTTSPDDATQDAPLADPQLARKVEAAKALLATDGEAARREHERHRGFVTLADGTLQMDARDTFDPTNPLLHLLFALCVGACTRRRAAFAPLLGATALVLAVLFIPALCTALVQTAGAPWIARRFASVPMSLHLAVVPSVFLALARDRWPRPATTLVSLIAAVGYATVFGVDREPWTRARYLEAARVPSELPGRLEKLRRKRELLRATIPSQAVVAAPLHVVGDLVMNCDCYRLALDTDEPPRGVKDMDERRAATRLLFDPEVPLAERVAVLRHYGVRHIFLPGEGARVLTAAYAPITVAVNQDQRTRILTVDPNARVE